MGLKLMAELGLDGSGFEAGFKRAESMAHGVAEGLKGFVIQAVGVLTVEAAISKTVETAKELVETSKRLAVAPEQLQVLRQAAKQSGVELGELASAFEKIDIARQKALLPGEEGRQQRRDFGAMGITSDMLHSKTAAQLFMGPLSAMAKNRNPEEFGALLRDIGIKGFGPLVAVLKQDFEGLGKKMKDMGAIMDTEAAVNLKLLGDELSTVATIIISQLAPAIVTVVEVMLEVIGKLHAGAAFIIERAKFELGKDNPAIPGFGGLAAQMAQTKIDRGEAGGFSKEEIEAAKTFLGTFNANADAAATKFDTIDESWKTRIAEMKAEIAAEAEALKHPKAPNFSGSSLPEKIPTKALQTPGDALTHVGNFLGGMGIAARIEERKVNLLQQIAHNTAQQKGGAHTGHGGNYGGFNSSEMGLGVPHF
jgi:hypothetical protein